MPPAARYVTHSREAKNRVESLLLDPPVAIPEDSSILQRPVSIAGRFQSVQHPWDRTIYDVWVHVAEEQFPNVWDVIAYIRDIGWNQVMDNDLPVELLSRESRICLAHNRAILLHPGDYYAAWSWSHDLGVPPRCPFDTPGHRHLPHGISDMGSPMCAMLWKQDVEGGYPVNQSDRLVTRTIKHNLERTQYLAFSPPAGAKRDARVGFFMKIPITYIDIQIPDRELDKEDGYSELLVERLEGHPLATF
jgi:hypothetical protein